MEEHKSNSTKDFDYKQAKSIKKNSNKTYQSKTNKVQSNMKKLWKNSLKNKKKIKIKSIKRKL